MVNNKRGLTEFDAHLAGWDINVLDDDGAVATRGLHDTLCDATGGCISRVSIGNMSRDRTLCTYMYMSVDTIST